MKTIKTVLTLLSVFLLSITLTGCPGDDDPLSGISGCTSAPNSCIPSNTNLTRSINGFDANPNSSHYNQPVVNFNFSQATTSYTAPNYCTICPSMSASVTLILTNATNQTIHFDYGIFFALNAVSWDYQGVATIAPNGTLNVGQVSASPASISLGQFSLQSSAITYN